MQLSGDEARQPEVQGQSRLHEMLPTRNQTMCLPPPGQQAGLGVVNSHSPQVPPVPSHVPTGLPLSDPSGLLSHRTFVLQSLVLRKLRPAGQTVRQINSMFLYSSWQSRAGLRSRVCFVHGKSLAGLSSSCRLLARASRMGDNGCRGN